MRDLSLFAAIVTNCWLAPFAFAQQFDFNLAPKPPRPEIVKEWRTAGAGLGSTGSHMDGSPGRGRSPIEAVDSERIPAFDLGYTRWKEGRIATLPDPGEPFGLDLFLAPITDDDLKELAGLTSL